MPSPVTLPDLPIRAALPALLQHLEARSNVVLQAPPGAGKTTVVPLALLDASWLDSRAKIIMLEPRRLAARAAATRMAALLGESVGATCGYRTRLDSRVGPKTRIEVVTDGIFTRQIQDNAELEGIGAVLFDEFHERRLDSDLALALCLDAQAALRPDLRLIAMSATLDAGSLAEVMAEEASPAPVVTSLGRTFPVEMRHLAAPANNRLAEAVASAVALALEEPGGILVFLPGGAEIRRVQRVLEQAGLPRDIDLMPLYGDLDPTAQDKALAPSPPGRRKVVLSTAIAETSLTIDGIRQVVDAGLSRVSRYDPRSGMTRLETVKVTQAGSEQRAGRGGRTSPGIGWRLWPEATADLTPLALELAVWGVQDASALRLPDAPNAAALSAARTLLAQLGALAADGRPTGHGRRMAGFGLHPRLSHMLLKSAEAGDGVLASAIAAALGERDLGTGRDSDLRAWLERIESPRGHDAAQRAREMARRYARQLGISWGPVRPARAGSVLALAYPDRVAQRRADGRYRLSGGQGAWVAEADPLAAETFLAVADLDGQVPDARIWLAAPMTRQEMIEALPDLVTSEDEVVWEPATNSVRARRRQRLGALVLGETLIDRPPQDAVTAALIDGIRRLGLAALPWSNEATALRQRIAFLRSRDGEEGGWPDMSDDGLLAGLDDWLSPCLGSSRNAADLAKLDLAKALRDRLEWSKTQELDRRAPTHLTVPSGSRIAIDYGEASPVLAVKLQEMFGLAETPAIDNGRVRLVLHLLSPAQRPIQVTSDLGGFWAGSYKAVRADLRGRYPKHSWPDDPMAAVPTARAKPRSPQ